MHNIKSGYLVLLCGEGRYLLVVVWLCAVDGKEIKVTTAEKLRGCHTPRAGAGGYARGLL